MYIKQIIDFFNSPVIIIVGGLTVITAILGLIYRILCIILGISPLVVRIGNALWGRKIAIIGNTDSFTNLNECLTDSKIFQKKNIIHIPTTNIDKIKEFSIILIDWDSCNSSIDNIFNSRKNHNTAVIIFAKSGTIPNEKMSEIGNKANTVVVNFKGRLLNDILNSLITTSFDGK
jgi:hypothetical protein